MPCTSCGKKRQALAQAQAADAAALASWQRPHAQTTGPRTLGEEAGALLRYILDLPIKVRGQVSGREYEFTRQNALQNIDARDADELLRSRLFRRLG